MYAGPAWFFRHLLLPEATRLKEITCGLQLFAQLRPDGVGKSCITPVVIVLCLTVSAACMAHQQPESGLPNAGLTRRRNMRKTSTDHYRPKALPPSKNQHATPLNDIAVGNSGTSIRGQRVPDIFVRATWGGGSYRVAGALDASEPRFARMPLWHAFKISQVAGFMTSFTDFALQSRRLRGRRCDNRVLGDDDISPKV